MSRRCSVLLLAMVLTPGCVPVTEPLGDADKSEQDKSLLGSWAEPEKPNKAVLRIETREVKGNPKGMMVMNFIEGRKEEPVWFFVTTIGKDRYGNLCMDVDNTTEGNGGAKLEKEGDYAQWLKSPGRRYFLFHYSSGQDGFVINFGDELAFKKLMETEKIEADRTGCFKTPAGWMEKYLTKNSRDAIFPASKEAKLVKIRN